MPAQFNSRESFFAKWLNRWRLYVERARHNAWANDRAFTSVIAPDKQAEGMLTEAHRLYWVRHYLEKGADPNFCKAHPYSKDAGRYRALDKGRSLLSVSVIYPSIAKCLVENGAHFDACAMETALLFMNLDQFKKRHTPTHQWDMSGCAQSIEAMFSSRVVSAPLRKEYLDLLDMKIKPAYKILARLYPPAQSFIEGELLDEATQDIKNEAQQPRPRL